MKLTRFRDINQFPHCGYKVDVSWRYLEDHINGDINDYGLDLNPDFQRAHVWTKQQQIDYCEYALQGGTSGKELYFNCNGWNSLPEGPYVIVDGKQMKKTQNFDGDEFLSFVQVKSMRIMKEIEAL